MIMSTLVSRPTSWFRDELYAASRAVSGAFERMTAHRQEKANAFVRTYLARLSDSELANLNYSAAEIAAIKAARKTELPYHF